MPMYTYRREDGTTFDIRQKFLDDPLMVCPTTGQKVIRVVQPAGIIFKGSGFYVNDSKNASRSSINNTSSSNGHSKDSTDKSSDKSGDSKKTESAPAAKSTDTPATPSSSVAAD
ncbi:MAG: FmdB family transcriptional regulator [Anaerolineaceae bacterium]|nr:FmdB family transcriptional regulator [Anaerolineaceae bacterium]